MNTHLVINGHLACPRNMAIHDYSDDIEDVTCAECKAWHRAQELKEETVDAAN